MARIRTVKPDLFKSPSLRHLSIEARYLAIGLLTEADDQGRFIASAKLLAGSLFPHDDDVSVLKVERWLKAIEEVGMIELYSVDGVRYGSFPKWADHQRISHPALSRLPNSSGEVPVQNGSDSALNREQGKEQGIGKAGLTAAFEKFWSIYPRKVGRGAAEKAFVKAVLRAKDPAPILAGAERYRDDPSRDPDLRYTAHPSTWLNQDRWLDEAAEAPRRRTTDDVKAALDQLGGSDVDR